MKDIARAAGPFLAMGHGVLERLAILHPTVTAPGRNASRLFNAHHLVFDPRTRAVRIRFWGKKKRA